MGTMIQYVTTRMRSVFMFFLFAFIWSSLIQGEAGLFLNLLVGIRAALLLYALWFILRFVISAGMKPGMRRSAFNRHRHSVPAA